MRENLKINRNGKYTTAVETGHLIDGINLILKRYPWVDVDWLLDNDKYYVKDCVVAVVSCHEEDVPNEATGDAEAMKKLNRMVMQQREAAVKAFERYISKQMCNPATKNAEYKEK